MQLGRVLQGDPALLYMERYVDEGTRSYSPFAAKSEIASDYQPRSHQPSFELASAWVPPESVSVFEADPDVRLQEYYRAEQRVRFVVHPETWHDDDVERLDELRSWPRAEPIQVAPTASTRTVLTTAPPRDVPTHFIKLHCPKRISRFNRRLRRKNIENSVTATRDLAHVRFEKFAYLPDTLGICYGTGDQAWGFLIREHTPRPSRARRFLIPGFALYGGDLDQPDDRSLLVQLIDESGANPKRFIVDEIMIPIVECWAKVVRERGILLESHAQNVLIEIDDNFRPTRIVHRDCDVWVDNEVRTRAGLDLPFRGASIGSDTAFPREQHYSLVYDHFLGRELFEFLLAAASHAYGLAQEPIRRDVAAAFHDLFPDANDFLPRKTTFYFSNEILPGNEFHLVDTGQAPRWR